VEEFDRLFDSLFENSTAYKKVIIAEGIIQNENSIGLVDNEVMLGDLFG
jgi:hypothetical protein